MDGLYSDDTRHLSRWVMRVNGATKLLSSGLRDHASAVIYAQHDVGTTSQPSPLATVRELFISAGALQERLVLENHGSGVISVVVRYEFDCDFLDLFEVKSQSFGERDLAFAKTITPLRTGRGFDYRDGRLRVRRRGWRLRGRLPYRVLRGGRAGRSRAATSR